MLHHGARGALPVVFEAGVGNLSMLGHRALQTAFDHLAAHHAQTDVLRLDAGVQIGQVFIGQHGDQRGMELVVQFVEPPELLCLGVFMEDI